MMLFQSSSIRSLGTRVISTRSGMGDGPWNKSTQPHPKSTRVARFRPDLPSLTPTQSDPLAMSVYDARCEVSSDRSSTPIKLQISQAGSCLGLISMGGWKNRDPLLECFCLDKGDDVHSRFMESSFLEPGLEEIAYHMAMDESRRLVFVGDSSRVKSYSWASSDGTYHKKPFPTHTLQSNEFSGPITVLPNGTIVRSGNGNAAAWEIATLDTHGEKGWDIIGEEMDIDDLDTWRDDAEENVELSTGNSPHSHITFVDQPNFKPSVWQPLINSPSTLLCAAEGFYGCVAIDLEHGGKTSTSYTGRGGTVSNFSTSAENPQLFLTTCHDGYACLFDVRQSQPVITLGEQGDSFSEAVALAHPDGIPTVFAGATEEEQIIMWDVRAQAPVYELATGNNAVLSLSWDTKRSCLYAATQCTYMDRLGYRNDYRRARMPKRGYADESKYDLEGNRKCWPSEAFHEEDYFGFAFDAGIHRIYRYAFKQDPDPSVLPEYGDAQLNEYDDR